MRVWASGSVRARMHWANFCLFYKKKSVSSSPIQVRLVTFRSTKFCQGLLNFKDAVVLPLLGARQIFVKCEIWQICQFTHHDLKENVNQENLISIFSQSVSAQSLPKLFHICMAIKQWRWKICTSIRCMMIFTQNTTITVPKFPFQLHLQGQVLFNFYIPMQTDQIHICMQTTRVSRVQV